MRRISLIIVFLTLLALAGVLSSCQSAENPAVSSPSVEPAVSLNDVSSLIPKSAQSVSTSGSGSPDADIQLTAPFPVVPASLVVYQITGVDDTRALNIAKSFGLENSPVPLKGGKRQVYSYAAHGEVLEINLDGHLRLYQQNRSVDIPVSLPSEDECVDIARNYLSSKGLLPKNILQIKTGVSKTLGTAQKGSPAATEVHLQITVSCVTGMNGYALYGAGPGVTIGNQGKVIELNYFQSELNEYGLVNLKTPGAAYSMLTEYLKDPSFNPVHADECLTNWRGFQRLTIGSITLQYSSPNLWYLQPVYVLEGDVYLVGQPDPEHFLAVVDAILRPGTLETSSPPH
jgi:hypothetical protein